MKLSDNFTTEEATRSTKAIQLGIDNSMDCETQCRACWMARQVLQPLRDVVGQMNISSWYRSPALNKAVGGVPTSEHLNGMAVDFLIDGLTTHQTYETALETLKTLQIPFDQLIEERNRKTGVTWVHLGVRKTGNRYETFKLEV